MQTKITNVTKATRVIEIDAAHRVPSHRSKCRNVHGHRYKIELSVVGSLAESGAEQGMVMDFGFMKELLESYIEEMFDHVLILWSKDPLLDALALDEVDMQEIKKCREEQTPAPIQVDGICGKITVVSQIPTAENLAALWFATLESPISVVSSGRAYIHAIRVWETGKSFVDYPL